MRSSNVKKVKNVSTCSEKYPENGLPKKKKDENDFCELEDEDGEDVGQRIRDLASKVVQDVVRLASETAKGRLADNPLEGVSENGNVSTNSPQQQTPRDNHTLERVPTILIDTIPSAPSSPTEWPPPPPEDTIVEEDETWIDDADIDVTFSQEDSSIPDDVQEFAAHYVADILTKAIEIVDEKRKLEDEQDARDVASRLVEDVIAKANEAAMKKLSKGLTFPDDVPSIQIDTIASLPPSPEDSVEERIECLEEVEKITEDVVVTVQPKRDEPAKSRSIPEIVCDHCEDLPASEDEDDEEEELEKAKTKIANLLKFSDAPEDIRNFASSYVKDIVSRAITMAEEKLVNSVPFSFDVDFMKVNGPWYIRAREALMRILRLACFCTPRRTDT